MTTAIYPGTFNPWHEGHTDILLKALHIFDKVVIAVGNNPDKPRIENDLRVEKIQKHMKLIFAGYNIEVKSFNGFLVDFVKREQAQAVIRGLRNIDDFEKEKTQQYINEDLGLTAQVVYLITDRKYVHISSSAMRAIERIDNERKHS